ncbi:hypothetical protein T02_9818, partial [Trichinella nativa]
LIICNCCSEGRLTTFIIVLLINNMILYFVLFCIAQYLHTNSAIPLEDNTVANLINEHKVEKRQLLRGLEREVLRDDRLMDRMINQEFRDERIMNNQLRRDERLMMRDNMIPFGGGLYNDPFIQPYGGFYY